MGVGVGPVGIFVRARALVCVKEGVLVVDISALGGGVGETVCVCVCVNERVRESDSRRS